MVIPVGVVPAVVAAVALALQALCIRVGTEGGRATDAVVVGLLTNVALILPLTAVLYYPGFGLTVRSALAFATAGIVGSMLGRSFYFAGISRAGASRAEAIKASQSLHAALLAVVFVGESLSGPHLAAIGLIVAGLVLLATESADDPLTGESITLGSLAYPLAGAFFFGVEPVLAKLGFGGGTTTLVGVSLKVLAATVGFLAYLGWRGALPTRRSMGSDLRWFVAAGVANTVFVVGYYTALSLSSVSVVVPIVQTSPLFVVFGSALVLREYEQVTPRLVVAAVVVVCGAVGVSLLG